MGNPIVAVLIWFFILVAYIVGLVVGYNGSHEQEINEAIAQCESELPRNKQCEVVITARVEE